MKHLCTATFLLLTLVTVTHAAPPATYLTGFPYKTGPLKIALIAIDPDNPTVPLFRTSPGNSPFIAYQAGEIFVPPTTFVDIHSKAVVYRSANKMWRLNLLKSGSLAPVQLSNESNADDICSTQTALGGYTHFVYQLPGPDDNCFQETDNEYKVARFDMGPSDNPLPAKRVVIDIQDAQANLIGWLAIDGNQLKRYDVNFGNGQTVATFTTDVVWLTTDIPSTTILLRIDNALKAYTISTGALSTSLYDFINPISGCCGFQDANFSYFWDSPVSSFSGTARILRVPSDGSALATTLATETGSAIVAHLTTNRVVYTLNVPGTVTIKSISKSGGAEIILESSPFATALPLVVAGRGTIVYYNRKPTGIGGHSTAVSINEDGTGRVETANTEWAGYVHPTTCDLITDGFCLWPEKMLRVEGPGVGNGTLAGASLKSFTVGSNTLVANLGTFQGGHDFFNFDWGDKAIGTLNTIAGINDAYYYDAAVPNSLVKINATVGTAGDYDNDGKTDVGIYRDGTWAILGSSNGGLIVDSLGGPSHTPVPADYDGDGKNDIAVYIPVNGQWSIKRSSDGVVTIVSHGGGSFLPVPADYDGDGKADIAVYANGVWSILRSSDGGNTVVAHGGPGWTPVPADYDGDGKTDIAVYINGAWSIKKSLLNTIDVFGHGGPTWVPIPEDYDGDGNADIAVYTAGAWSVKRSSDTMIAVTGHGGPGWTPVPADYDGDSKSDIAVYNTAGAWSIIKSSTNTIQVVGHGGGPTDVPLN